MTTPSSALQDAVAMLTLAMHKESSELDEVIDEFLAKAAPDDLLRAVVGLCRSLCLATSRMVHVIDDELTTREGDALTNDELLPVALEVVRRYAQAAAHRAAVDSAGGGE